MPADLNGDGCTDIVRATTWDIFGWISNCSSVSEQALQAGVKLIPGVPTNWGGTQGWRVADLNGDGKDDIVRAAKWDIFGWYSNGTSLNTGITLIPGVPTNWGGDDESWAIADLNGDGCADVVRPVTWDIFGWMSTCQAVQNQALAPGIKLVPGLGSGQGGTMGWRVADINGDGLSDIIRASKSVTSG